ncbi:hypothetical protein DLM76_18235 [Leptospira yasudae]|uniref:hypothetical protein n=1 Tax=Leptospira yasudae TaxID=2202201 RepID=UPI000E59DA76|nr:hypothetical protein [Leptospira yasudae]RHX91646.1 hypothetical protein DLM76_18235 [Leptospira yasudae]
MNLKSNFILKQYRILWIALIWFLFFSNSCITIYRNSSKNDFSIPNLDEKAPKLGVVVIYESPPLGYQRGPFTELSISDDLKEEFAEHPKLKLIAIHSTESYSKLEGNLRNVLVLRFSKFASWVNWTFYASFLTLFVIPNYNTRDFKLTAELYDKNGRSETLPSISNDAIYAQTWTQILLLPFYWLSPKGTVIDPNIYKSVRTVMETPELVSKLSGDILTDYKVIKTAPLDYGTIALKVNIKNVEKVDSYYRVVVGGGGPPRKDKILPTHPEQDDFVKITVEYENASDANAWVTPSQFIPYPSLWELQRRIADPAQFPGAEIHTGQSQHIDYVPFDPKTFITFRAPREAMLLEPKTSIKRIYYFQYPKGKNPEFFVYNGRQVEVK